MKKSLKFLFYFVLFIVALMLVLPLVFKGKALDMAKTELNKTMNANVDFANIKLSFFKDFPHFSVSLQNLTVTGKQPFDNDTLVAFKSFDVAVDVISAIKMENIKIVQISLVEPLINGIVLEDGTANWDIMPESTDTLNNTEADTASSVFDGNLHLKLFEIVRAKIRYTDQSSGIKAELNDFNFALKGDFSQSFTVLDIDSRTADVNLVMDGIRYVKHASLLMDINLDANLAENQYVIKENEIAINELSLGFDGSIDMLQEGNIQMDIKFGTKKTDFKSVLSMVPAVYLNGFEGIETAGAFQLEGKIKGKLTEVINPSAYVKFIVEDAMFNYPELPESVNNIRVNLEVNYDGAYEDNTTVSVNDFHLEIAGNPVDLTLNVATPMTDMQVNGLFKTNMQLATIADAVPMTDTKIMGHITSTLDFMGRLSYIENEEYEKFKADGKVSITDFAYTSPDFAQGVAITSANMHFSPKYLALNNFDAKIGGSDIALHGRIENFIPFVFDNQVIKGQLSLASNTLDVNEFMSEPASEEQSETEVSNDTSAMQLIEVPKNIDFLLQTSINKVYYDKLEITNLEGEIVIHDGVLDMKNLSMNMLGGSMALNGEYNTRDTENPLADFGVNVKNFDIPATFQSVSFIQNFIPVGENTSGRISTSFNLTSYLKQDMKPVLNSIVADGSFEASNVRVKQADVLSKVGEVLSTDKFTDISLKDFYGNFQIRNGRLFVEPFETKFGSTTMVLGGDQGIDQSLNLVMNLVTPRSALGAGSEQLVSGLASNLQAQGIAYTPEENLDMAFDIGGTIKNPTITPRLNVAKKAGNIKEAAKTEIKKNIQAEADKKKEEAKHQAREQADKIIAAAEKKADELRAAAKKSANAVRQEADRNADKLVSEAKNPIAKKAAELSAQKIRNEADAKADKIEREADSKAKKIISEAHKKAAALD